MAIIKFPFGKPDVKFMGTGNNTESGTGGQYNFEISNELTIIDGITQKGMKTRNIALAFNPSLKIGAKLYIWHAASVGTGTKKVTLGTGFAGLTQMSAANKKLMTAEFVYNGTHFIPSGSVFTQA